MNMMNPTPTSKKADTVSLFHVRLPTADKMMSTRSVALTNLPRVTATARMAAVALVIQGCGDSMESRSRPGLGKTWPLTVDAGVLNCLEYGDVTFTANGTLSALTALAPGNDIDPILADSPRGGKKKLRPLILRGRKLSAKPSD
jgi:hypothetical protein